MLALGVVIPLEGAILLTRGVPGLGSGDVGDLVGSGLPLLVWAWLV